MFRLTESAVVETFLLACQDHSPTSHYWSVELPLVTRSTYLPTYLQSQEEKSGGAVERAMTLTGQKVFSISVDCGSMDGKRRHGVKE
jgi:hypothetical protein